MRTCRVVALMVLLLGAACAPEAEFEKGPCDGDGPPRASPECAFDTGRRTCSYWIDRIGIDKLAQEYGARSSDPNDVARAYAKNINRFKSAAERGCLSGLDIGGQDSKETS